MSTTFIGSELRINTEAGGDQRSPSVAPLAGGGFVTAWIDVGDGPGSPRPYGVRAQIYGADGTKQGGEVAVLSTTTGGQSVVSVAKLAMGGFVVGWVDSDSARARVFNADGSAAGDEFVIAQAAPYWQTSKPLGVGWPPTALKVAGLADGRIVASWGNGHQANAQIFTAGGTPLGNAFSLAATASQQTGLSVTALANGGFAIASAKGNPSGFVNSSGTASSELAVEFFDAAGKKVGGTHLAGANNAVTSASVTSLPNGNAIVTWSSDEFSGTSVRNQSTFGRLFDVNGGSLGDAFVIGTATGPIRSEATTTSLSDGSFLLVWQDGSGSGADKSGTAIRAQHFDATGQRIDQELTVNTITEGMQQAPALSTLSDGSVVVAWTDYSKSDGDTSGSAVRAQHLSVAAPDPSRRVLVHDGTTPRELTMDRYSGPVTWLQNQYIGLSDGEAAVGSDLADFMNLLAGDDAAQGMAGDDVLDGGLGSNFLTGGGGADTFFLDGRGGGVTWSTVTDLEAGEWTIAWGWRPGVSGLTWEAMRGADGYQGATAHADLDGNGTIDLSVTFSGKALGAVTTMTGQVESDIYMAFRLV